MDERAAEAETDGRETITDIQNYLASFNKEIQDGDGVNGTVTAQLEAGDASVQASQPGETTATYYVTQAANGAEVEGYQYAQGEAQYGTTYYASSDGTYYAATTADPGQHDSITAYTTQGPGTPLGATVVPVAAQQASYQAVAAGDHAGIPQIVLAVTGNAGAGGEGVDGGAREISVAIPASITAQSSAGQNQMSDQPTFVAMQPGSSAEGHVDSGQATGRHALATLVTHAQDGTGHLEADVARALVQTQTIRMVVRQPDGTETEQTIPVSNTRTPTLVTSDGQEIHISDEGTLQMMATLAEQAATGALTDGSNQVILNAGNSTYQTVTIMPSDTNPGEVSYVLIVSQSDDDKDGQKELDLDMSVYDFNEGEKHGEIVSEEVAPDGTKTRTIRITQKKSQMVTQAHMCNYCNYTSPKRYLLSRHMKSHSEERPHKCSVCERGFKTLASLQNHVNTHTGTRPHMCRDCDASFTTSGELVRHVRYRHTHEKPHKCTECDYASVELSKLKRHKRCHTGERPYQCPHCTYASPDMYKLKRHLRIHTGEKPYECDVCQARFTQSNSLKAHKLIHSGNKPSFHCEFCPTTCGRKTDLRIHMQKLHTSDKPLKCKRCGKTFPDRYSYKLHSKTHEGEKCFKCDLCPYASISQRHLESHMLIHTDQKPFQCDECDQAFRQKQLLRRHKNLYHDPNYVPPVPKEKTNECSECHKTFRHKGNLIRHLAIHDPDATAAEKEEALRIGEPKGPGEQPDGEEDYYIEGEEDVDGNSLVTLRMATQNTMETEDGQQVVVFEVIKFDPNENEGKDNATEEEVTLNGEANELTMLQTVSNDGLAEAVAAAVADEAEDSSANTAPATPRRGRGRPRKVGTPDVAKSSEKEQEEAAASPAVASRQARKRQATGENQDVIAEATPEAIIPQAKRGRPVRTCRLRKDEMPSAAEVLTLMPLEVPDIPSVAADPEEIARREAELTRRRLEQKEKDMAECFGFNDDEEEMETILAMPAVPGAQPVTHTTRNVEEINPEVSEAGTLLLSMQQNGTLEQLT